VRTYSYMWIPVFVWHAKDCKLSIMSEDGRRINDDWIEICVSLERPIPSGWAKRIADNLRAVADQLDPPKEAK
jgi:hypothetical protein